MAIQHKPHIHSGHGGPYESTFVYDDAAGSQPGLLLFPNFFGAKQWDIDKAAVLTQLGYKVLVVDYYGQGKRGTDMESSAVLMQKFTADRAAMRGQLLDALSELRKLPGVDASRTGRRVLSKGAQDAPGRWSPVSNGECNRDRRPVGR
jgi:dienelactone hydrolase